MRKVRARMCPTFSTVRKCAERLFSTFPQGVRELPGGKAEPRPPAVEQVAGSLWTALSSNIFLVFLVDIGKC